MASPPRGNHVHFIDTELPFRFPLSVIPSLHLIVPPARTPLFSASKPGTCQNNELWFIQTMMWQMALWVACFGIFGNWAGRRMAEDVLLWEGPLLSDGTSASHTEDPRFSLWQHFLVGPQMVSASNLWPIQRYIDLNRRQFHTLIRSIQGQIILWVQNISDFRSLGWALLSGFPL